MSGSPLGGAVAPGGPGGGGPPSGTAGGDLSGTYPNPTVRRAAHVIYRQGVASPAPGQYATWAAALAAAQALAGRVVIFVDDQDDPPAFPSGTYALDNRIEVVGLCASTERISMSVADGAVLQDAPRLANLSFSPVVSTPIFTSTRDGLDVELDNVFLLQSEVPGGSPTFQLNYTSSRILLRGGSWVQGGATGIGTLPATKSLNVTVERALLDANFIQGGAGNLYFVSFPGSIIPDLSAFSGSLSLTDKLRDQLADTGGAPFDFGAHRLENVADPTGPQHAATKASSEAAALAAVNTSNINSALGALGGDLSGSLPNPTVARINGTPVDLNTPAEGDILTVEDVSGTLKVRRIRPTQPQQLLVFDEAVGTLPYWEEAPELGILVAFAGYLGTSAYGFTLSAQSLSVAGSGAATLAASGLQAHTVRLTGALTGDRTLTLPAGNGAEHLFINDTTGAYLLRLQGPSGGFTYLLPGQSRRVSVGDDGVLRGEGLRVLVYSALVTLAGDTTAGSPVDHTLCKLPAGVTIKSNKARVTTAIAGSTSQISMGYTGTYDRLLKLSSISSLGTLLGNDTADLGTDWASTKLGVHLTSAETLKLRHSLTGADCSAGVVRVTVIAEYEGE